MRRLIAAALAGIFALASVGVAQADPIQSIEAKVMPKKLPKKKFKPAKLKVEIITGDNVGGNPANEPPKATNTKVNFPKNLRFKPNAVPSCKVSAGALQNTSTEQAIAACGRRSIVSVGSKVPTGPQPTNGTSAWIRIGGPSPLGEPVVVTAFNGKEKNALYLHSRAQTFPITSVLIGKLKKGPKGFGKQLDVTVPILPAGGIERFTVTVKAKRYIQARCKPKRMRYQAITTFSNHPRVKDNYVDRCKVKKAKRKKRR
jgi:hypothetical protein